MAVLLAVVPEAAESKQSPCLKALWQPRLLRGVCSLVTDLLLLLRVIRLVTGHFSLAAEFVSLSLSLLDLS